MILAYCRVSTVEQAQDGTTSLAEQARKCKAIADLNSAGPYDFQVYQDVGVSGSVPLGERPEGRKLLADIKPSDILVASKMDRLFRSASDALNTADLFRKQGIKLVLTDMGTDSVTDNGVSKMFFGMLALVAEFERERISERMVEAKRAKKAKGGHIAGSAPYGYGVVGVGRDSRLVPVELEQHTIKRIIELRQEIDESKPNVIGRVRQQLEREQIKARNGTPFQTIQVRRILARSAEGEQA